MQVERAVILRGLVNRMESLRENHGRLDDQPDEVFWQISDAEHRVVNFVLDEVKGTVPTPEAVVVSGDRKIYAVDLKYRRVNPIGVAYRKLPCDREIFAVLEVG